MVIDLKWDLSFFAYFFLNSLELELIDIKIINPGDSFITGNYSALPVSINKQISFLILYSNFDINMEKLLDEIKESLSVISSITFKEYNLTASEKSNLRISIKTELLLIKYRYTQSAKSFFLVFSKNSIIALISELQYTRKRKEENLIDILYKFKQNFSANLSTFPWDIEVFIKNMDNKSIQTMINMLFSNNIVEETMMAAFIAGIGAVGKRLLKSCSKNLQSDITSALTHSIFNRKWQEEATYLIKISLGDLVRQGAIKYFYSSEYECLRNQVRKSYFQKVFYKRSFKEWIKILVEKDGLQKFIGIFPLKKILISIVDEDNEVHEVIKSIFSKKRQLEIEKDINYFRNDLSNTEIIDTKFDVVKGIKDLLYEIEGKELDIYHIVNDLSNDDFNMVADEIGILDLARLSIKLQQKIKRAIVKKLIGTKRMIIRDIYNGIIRFKGAYGDKTINELKQKFTKIIWNFTEEGRIKYKGYDT